MIKSRLAVVMIILPLVVLLVVMMLWVNFLFKPLVTDDEGYRYLVRPGASLRFVVDDLYSKKIIQSPFFFNLLVRFHHAGSELKAGEYLFQKGTTSPKLLNQITTGTGMINHPFTIIAGWNFRQLGEALQKESNVKHTLQNLDDVSFMALLGHPELKPEGQFFPDTYFFVAGSSDVALLRRAFKAMQEKLYVAWLQRDKDSPFKTPNEALIAASLVEKEAYLAEERPIIAGVLINRLQKDMLLQCDPTVIYGMGLRFDGKISKEDLLADTPYNTYVHKGLTPTPIAMPSLASIMAVLHPEHHAYFYFVARGDRSHLFSKTLDEHHAAVLTAKLFYPEFFNENLAQHYLSRYVTLLQ